VLSRRAFIEKVAVGTAAGAALGLAWGAGRAEATARVRPSGARGGEPAEGLPPPPAGEAPRASTPSDSPQVMDAA